jgi:hypothetical protein
LLLVLPFICSLLILFNFLVTWICFVIRIICFQLYFAFHFSLLIFPSRCFSVPYCLFFPLLESLSSSSSLLIFLSLSEVPPVLAPFPAHCTLKHCVRHDPIAGSQPPSTGESSITVVMREPWDRKTTSRVPVYVRRLIAAKRRHFLRCPRARILWQ